jgi:bacterioferritin-associated ferredoxin
MTRRFDSRPAGWARSSSMTSRAQLRQQPHCGSCLDMAAGLLEQARVTRELPLPVLGLAVAA